MPLADRSGRPELPGTTPPLQSSPVSTEAVIDHQAYIEDTFVNKTALNPQTYAEEFQLLQRYAAGSRITVTYFLRSTPTGGLQRADAIDPSSQRNPVQTSYTEIKNFEIIVQGKGLQSGFNPDNQETKVTGEALLYPGMHPRNGDLFITPIGDAMFGVFQVTGPDRLTYRQGSNHRITFFLREYATEDGIAAIRRSVTKTVWFDKETYLGDATTLLKAESFICLKELRQMRRILINQYYNTFFDRQLNSIVSRAGVYDPYLVAFLNGKISILESIQRPAQLYPGLQNYDNCLWARLTDTTNRTLIGLQCNYRLDEYRASRWDVAITSLVNRVLVTLDNPNRQAMESTLTTPDYNVPAPPVMDIQRSLRPVATGEGYVLSPSFYAGDKITMTPFEFLVYAVIKDRQLLDIRTFIDLYLNRYAELSFEDRYYHIPLYLWLIDVAVDGIAAADTFMT
jgi:hypothetical protein